MLGHNIADLFTPLSNSIIPHPTSSNQSWIYPIAWCGCTNIPIACILECMSAMIGLTAHLQNFLNNNHFAQPILPNDFPLSNLHVLQSKHSCHNTKNVLQINHAGKAQRLPHFVCSH